MSPYKRGGGRGFQGRGDHSTAAHGSPSSKTGFNRNVLQNRLNPWEGGIAPGCSRNHLMNIHNPNMVHPNISNNTNIGGNRSSGGLLPTPNMPGQHLMHHPSMQDVQLAVAGNVLNFMLPNMPQNQQQNQVLPLLSLPLNAPFKNQSFGGLALQGPNGSTDNIGPNRQGPQLAARRPEPYNKMGNRNQRLGHKQDRKSSSSYSASRKVDVGSKNATQQARNIRQEKGVTRVDQKTEDGSSDKNNEDKLKRENDPGRDVEKAKAAYTDIPSEMLICHVCTKNMWDSVSFLNHLKGKAHQTMIDRQEESYKVQIDIMRRDMKVEEQQRQLAFERKQRHNKSCVPPSREYCTMCNLQFHGNLSAHRKSNSHQQLKSFLHPKCDICAKEFPTRIDWDQHLLTAGHLRAASSKRSKQGSEGNRNKRVKLGTDGNSNKPYEQTESEAVKQTESEAVKQTESEAVKQTDSGAVKQTESGAVKQTESGAVKHTESGAVKQTESGAVKQTESEACKQSHSEPFNSKIEITLVKEPAKEGEKPTSTRSLESVENDFKRDDHTAPNIPAVGIEVIPTFDSQSEIGMELLEEKTGYLCRCCNRFLSSSADAKTHCRSKFHYEKYVNYLNSKVSTPTISPKQNGTGIIPSHIEKEKPEGKINEQLKKNTDVKREPIEEGEDEEDDSNWKRKKITYNEDTLTVDVAQQTKHMDENQESNFDIKDNVNIESNLNACKDKDTSTLSDVNGEKGMSEDLEKTLLQEPHKHVDKIPLQEPSEDLEKTRLLEPSESLEKTLLLEPSEDLEKTVLLEPSEDLEKTVLLEPSEDLEKTLLVDRVPTPRAMRSGGGTPQGRRGRSRK